MKKTALEQSKIHDGSLILINRAHPFAGHVPPLCMVSENGVQLARNVAQLLTACLHAIDAHGKILPVSGWRSHAEQFALYQSAVRDHGSDFAEKYVALAGCSEHESGLAIDLALAMPKIDPICPVFPDDGVCGTFKKVAAKYGFILRYPREKEKWTGISYEPWHFRYVGVPHAQIMDENGLCLEEYAAFLKKKPLRICLSDDISAQVFYIPFKENIALPIQNDVHMQISGDNCCGFIVTKWNMRV